MNECVNKILQKHRIFLIRESIIGIINDELEEMKHVNKSQTDKYKYYYVLHININDRCILST